jgi:hypothetical protein
MHSSAALLATISALAAAAPATASAPANAPSALGCAPTASADGALIAVDCEVSVDVGGPHSPARKVKKPKPKVRPCWVDGGQTPGGVGCRITFTF